MPQGNPKGYLTEELMNGPQEMQPQAVASQGVSSLRPMVENEVDDFMVTLFEIADAHGALDEAFQEGANIEDRLESLDSDALEGITREELITLVDKFMKLDPQVQEQMLAMVREEDPKLHSRIMAAIRSFAPNNSTGATVDGL